MHNKKRIKLLLVAVFIHCSWAFAQELSIKSMVESSSDLTARTLPRKDINGIECALLKVLIVGKGVITGDGTH